MAMLAATDAHWGRRESADEQRRNLWVLCRAVLDASAPFCGNLCKDSFRWEMSDGETAAGRAGDHPPHSLLFAGELSCRVACVPL